MKGLLGPDGGPSDPDVDIVGASGSAPASPEPSLKKPFRGFLAGADGAERFMRLERESPPSDTPLIVPKDWPSEADPRLIEALRKELQAQRELHAFLMEMHDNRIRREARENGPGKNNKQADDKQVQGLLNRHDGAVEAARREFADLHPEDTRPAASKRFTRSLKRINEREYYKSKGI